MEHDFDELDFALYYQGLTQPAFNRIAICTILKRPKGHCTKMSLAISREKACREMTPLYSKLSKAAHVWVLEAEGPQDETLTKQLFRILNHQERARYYRFQFDRDRDLYLRSHGLMRLVLSQYIHVAPGDWQFDTGQNGRPEIAAPLGAANRLRANLTHTRGLAACVVTAQADCGIDAEHRHPLNDLMALSERVLHPSELPTFRTLPAACQLDRFLDFWVAKEACVKACGRGLSLAPRTLALEFSAFRTQAWVNQAPDELDWQIWLTRPTSQHHLAVALGASEPMDVNLQWASSDLGSLIENMKTLGHPAIF